jgi:hypothetical protein
MNPLDEGRHRNRTLFGGTPAARSSWLGWGLAQLAMTAFLTFASAGIGMGLGTLAGIIFVALRGAAGATVNVDWSYRLVGVPVASLCGLIAFGWSLRRSVRSTRERMH